MRRLKRFLEIKVDRRWLSCKEVGEYLNLNYKTIFDLVYRGMIPATKIGGSVRIDKKKLDEILEKNSTVSVVDQLKKGGM